jgi:hypothetical protein
MSFFPMPESSRLGDYVGFSDESSITKWRFMVIGGVVCRADMANRIASHIKSFKRGKTGDSFQWKNFNKSSLSMYIDFADIVLEYINSQKMDFGALIVPNKELNHDRFSGGDGEVTFHRMLYLYYMAYSKYYPPSSRIKIVHGQRDGSQPLSETRRILNANRVSIPSLELKHCDFVDAKYADVSKCELLQIADVFIGAAAWLWNEKHLNGAAHKTALAHHIQSNCPATSLTAASWKPNFWIWRFQPRR